MIRTVQAATPPSTGFSSWITRSSAGPLSGVTEFSVVCVGLREGPDGAQLLSSNCSTEVWVVIVAIWVKSLTRISFKMKVGDALMRNLKGLELWVDLHSFLSHRNVKSGVFVRLSKTMIPDVVERRCDFPITYQSV